jgi:predicted ArsR family transcriptional regulator
VTDAELIGREEAAAILGISPDSVRSTLRRYGVTERRGYVRSEVEGVRRVGRGRRTDLDHEEDA